jgi:hypothetical protein
MYSHRQIFETMRLLYVLHSECVVHEHGILDALRRLAAESSDAYRAYWEGKLQQVENSGSLFQGEKEQPLNERLFIWGTIAALQDAEEDGTLTDNLLLSWQEMNREFPGLWEEGMAGTLPA